MHCLLDADSIVFRCGFAVEHKKHKFFIKGEEHLGPFQVYEYKKEIPKEFKDDPELSYEEEVSVEPLQNALHLVRQEIEGIISATDATSYQVYIKGKGNFREKISVTRVYKGNRDVTHRPKYEHEIRHYLKEFWKAEEVDGEEVDDRCAIEQTKNPTGTIIASIDKDFNQVVGWKFNFMKKEKYWVDEAQAERNFYLQLLTGDASDNIQGISKVGPVAAAEILGEARASRDMYLHCKMAYMNHYGPSIGNEIMTEMANLVYLRRSEDDVWQPPK